MYGPAPATRGRGACVDGTMTCSDEIGLGTWGPCMGEAIPSEEVCDAAGVDESGDGAANEGCDCDPSTGPVACGTDVGACAPDTQACVAGRLGACMGASARRTSAAMPGRRLRRLPRRGAAPGVR